MSDWVGNTKSIYSIIAASNHSETERQKDDYYATDPKAIDYLLEKAIIGKNIWECACGAGHLSKRLIELGYNVKSTDLVNRGFSGGVRTSSRFLIYGMETFLQIHHINMRKSLLNMLWKLFPTDEKYLCFLN